jgi:hypothetical protein
MGEDFGSWLFLSFHILLVLLTFHMLLILLSLFYELSIAIVVVIAQQASHLQVVSLDSFVAISTLSFPFPILNFSSKFIHYHIYLTPNLLLLSKKSQFSSCPNSLEVNLVANSNIRSSATQVSSDSSNNLLVPQCDGLSIL